MKKIIITLGVLFAASTAFTQGAYGTLGLGYAGSTNTEQIGATTVISATGATSTNISGSFGKGIPVNLNLGYMISEHFGVELGFTYLLGSNLTIEDMKHDAATPGSIKSRLTTTKGSSLRVSPRLVMNTSLMGLNLYSKLGLIVPVSGKTTFEQTIVTNGGATDVTAVIQGESAGKFSMGYNAAIGLSFPIGGNLSVFGELDLISLRINSKSKTLTSFSVDGDEKISTFTKDFTHTEYVDEVGPDDNTKVTESTKALGTSGNYNSFGINVGIKMTF